MWDVFVGVLALYGGYSMLRGLGRWYRGHFPEFFKASAEPSKPVQATALKVYLSEPSPPDSFVDSEAEDETIQIEPTLVSFSYIDSEGEMTDREVAVRLVTPSYFLGRCKLRKKDRTFRWDRVVGRMVIDKDGRAIQPADGYIELALLVH